MQPRDSMIPRCKLVVLQSLSVRFFTFTSVMKLFGIADCPTSRKKLESASRERKKLEKIVMSQFKSIVHRYTKAFPNHALIFQIRRDKVGCFRLLKANGTTVGDNSSEHWKEKWYNLRNIFRQRLFFL